MDSVKFNMFVWQTVCLCLTWKWSEIALMECFFLLFAWSALVWNLTIESKWILQIPEPFCYINGLIMFYSYINGFILHIHHIKTSNSIIIAHTWGQLFVFKTLTLNIKQNHETHAALPWMIYQTMLSVKERCAIILLCNYKWSAL